MSEIEITSKETDDEEMDYEALVRYVNRSTYRVRVLKDLSESNAKIPRDIAHDCDILQNHISNVLTDLRKRGLLEILNPEFHKGRLYRLSDEGRDIIKDLK